MASELGDEVESVASEESEESEDSVSIDSTEVWFTVDLKWVEYIDNHLNHSSALFLISLINNSKNL